MYKIALYIYMYNIILTLYFTIKYIHTLQDVGNPQSTNQK